MAAEAISSSLLLLIIFSFSSLAASQTTTEDGERQILLRIREDWGKPSVLSAWNDSTSTNHCNWTGIGCSADGSVTNITLVNQNITQPIPATICKLRSLSFLDLSYNYITDPFPTSLYNCSNLLHLDLSWNHFVGVIPATICELRSLSFLDLSYNYITDPFPTSLCNCSNLLHLDLSWNQFVGVIPAAICELRSLSFLDLSNNYITTSFPTSLYNCSNLLHLDLSWNHFVGVIPAAICELRSLSFLDLSNNYITTSFPTSLYNCSNLLHLDLSCNHFVGVIPSDIYRLSPGLTDLILSYNNFIGDIPPSIGRLQAIKNLALDGNPFAPATIPSTFRNLTQLSSLLMSSTNLKGEIPEFIGELTEMSQLHLSENSLSGSIPAGIWSLKELQSLDLFANDLTGEINVDGPIGALGLEEINVANNQLSGSIPAAFGMLQILSLLFMDDNRLSGKIPTAIGSLPELTSLDLSINQLSGSIPPEIGELRLNWLNLSSNRLSGEIPISLQNEAYEGSFLSNPSLCASSGLVNVPVCKHGLSWRLRIILIVFASLVSLMATVFAVFRRRDHHGRSDGRDLPTWKMMSFYSLDFIESTILSGLTEDNLIGSGGGGKVYRIVLEDHVAQIVAVKKIWNTKKLDSLLEKEFQAEVQILGSIRHANIVKLLCCLWSIDTKLLVYEYMENGSLELWLHKKWRVGEQTEEMNSDHVPLDWPTRLRIAVDVARGLCYMHHGCSPPIVHRDVKSSNILLDSEFRAKIADFGLARMLVKPGEPNTVSAVAGTFGYMAPECAYSRKVNEKMDVYSFGVILLELTTGRKARDGGEYDNLAGWAWRCLQENNNKVIDAIDQDIKEPIDIKEIALVFKLGVMCTSPLPSSRPTMKDVLQILLRCQQASANVTMV